ncbi:hypothetical protein WR25_07058 [Diploscapter pachys]|uniref:Chondroitin proteoglycan 4 domain-containing protein n=1 Tax=Diploscapter pachys TaxID=2018661 RepID=A0A2A2JS43_9BILA|nr:hypothetical protein WR25_07058 [Diploscapter pachys]
MANRLSIIGLIGLIIVLSVDARIDSRPFARRRTHYKLDYETILGAIGTPDCVKKCIDPFMKVISEVWDKSSVVDKAATLCKERAKALKCIKSQFMCDDKNGFATASKSLEMYCPKQKLFDALRPCLKANLSTVIDTCDDRCKIRYGVHKFTHYDDVKLVSRLGGNMLTVADHLGEICGFVTCGIKCIVEELESKCGGITGFVGMVEVLLAPIESIAQGVDEMQPGMKLLIAARLDKKCHFFMSPTEVEKVRNFDFSGFNYVFKL